jgi:hypothetical protein
MQSNARQDSVTTQGKSVRIHVEIDKDAKNYDFEPEVNQPPRVSVASLAPTAPTTPTAVSAAAPSSLQDNAKESPKPQMKVVKESSKKIKEKRAIAEKNILAIYKLLEKSRINEAQYWFKRNRDFLNRYSYPEVVDVLEQTLIQSATAPPVAR